MTIRFHAAGPVLPPPPVPSPPVPVEELLAVEALVAVAGGPPPCPPEALEAGVAEEHAIEGADEASARRRRGSRFMTPC